MCGSRNICSNTANERLTCFFVSFQNFELLDFSLEDEDMAKINALDKKMRTNTSGRAWKIHFAC